MCVCFRSVGGAGVRGGLGRDGTRVFARTEPLWPGDSVPVGRVWRKTH